MRGYLNTCASRDVLGRTEDAGILPFERIIYVSVVWNIYNLIRH